MLGMGLANLIWANYGQQFLQTMSSVYPGYHATRSIARSSSGLSTERWMVSSVALCSLGFTTSLLNPVCSSREDLSKADAAKIRL